MLLHPLSTAASDNGYQVGVDPSHSLLLTKILNRDFSAIWQNQRFSYDPESRWLISRYTSLWSMFTHPVYGQKVVPYTTKQNWVACFFAPIWHIVTRTRHRLGVLVARIVYHVGCEVALIANGPSAQLAGVPTSRTRGDSDMAGRRRGYAPPSAGHV